MLALTRRWFPERAIVLVATPLEMDKVELREKL
jgi:hypothetical protein